MRTLIAQPPPLLSPTRRPLRTSRPLPKKVPLLEHEASPSPVQARRMCASSPSPKRPSIKKRQDFELCSSGAVLVLAKKVKANDRPSLRQVSAINSRINCNPFRTVDQELFSQRSQQKYRIRSRECSYERTQSTNTPPTVADFGKMVMSQQMTRVCIEPWEETKGDELSDLF